MGQVEKNCNLIKKTSRLHGCFMLNDYFTTEDKVLISLEMHRDIPNYNFMNIK